MMKQLKLAAVAVAVLASMGAQAKMNVTDSYNGSFAFMALDNIGTPTSIVADLGFKLDGNDVAANGFAGSTVMSLLNAPGTKIEWNFNSNTLKVNNVAQAGTYSWSVPFSLFQGSAQAVDTKWAVIAGATANFPNYYLTTGAPTQGQLDGQTQDVTANMALINTLFAINNGTTNVAGQVSSTQTNGTVGARALSGLTTQAAGYLGNPGIFGSTGNWLGNLNWSAYTKEGAANTSALWALDDSVDGAMKQAVSFKYSAGVLTATTPVPEPETYALMAAGLLALGLLRRRRV